MKAILEFNLDDPDDRRSHLEATKAKDTLIFLFDVEQQVFRPARKHGYPDNPIGRRLNELLDTNGATAEVIGLLEDYYWELKNQHGVGGID